MAKAIRRPALVRLLTIKIRPCFISPTNIPEPNRNGYQRMLERGIIELATALEGRVMALFTSYAQLRETSRKITPRLKLGDIIVCDQSFGANT